MQQGEREVESALHAAGVAADFAIGSVGQTDAFEQIVAALLQVGALHAMQRALQLDVLAARQEAIEGGLLQRSADRGAHLWALFDDVETSHRGCPRCWWQQRRQHQHRRRFAGTVRAKKPVDLAFGNGEVDAVDGTRPFFKLAHESAYFDCTHGWQSTTLLPARHGTRGRPIVCGM